MSMERLDQIITSLDRIEGKLDVSAAQFELHLHDDRLLAAQVNRLVKQRGAVTTATAATTAAIAGAAYWIKRKFLGH